VSDVLAYLYGTRISGLLVGGEISKEIRGEIGQESDHVIDLSMRLVDNINKIMINNYKH
jgi:hypothetical protein